MRSCCGAPDRGRLSVVLYVFHFLIIAPTGWFLHTKLLTYCRFSLPSLVQVYNFVSGVLWQLFGLGHSGVWSVTVWGCGQGVFYTDNEFKQMPLIQVTSGGQRSLLKKKLQVCESQQSCLFVGDQILIFHHNLQINSLKILQCDFLDFFSYFVSHSWVIPMMKITGFSHLFKWENLHNWWLTKYFFAPLYISIIILRKKHWIKCNDWVIYKCSSKAWTQKKPKWQSLLVMQNVTQWLLKKSNNQSVILITAKASFELGYKVNSHDDDRVLTRFLSHTDCANIQGHCHQT